MERIQDYTHFPEILWEGSGIYLKIVSWVYPIRIPKDPKVFILQEMPYVVSVWGTLNRNVFVSIIGGEELEECYMAHPNAFIYAVGSIKEKVKDGKTYRDLRPRGWLLVIIEESKGKSNKRNKK